MAGLSPDIGTRTNVRHSQHDTEGTKANGPKEGVHDDLLQTQGSGAVQGDTLEKLEKLQPLPYRFTLSLRFTLLVHA